MVNPPKRVNPNPAKNQTLELYSVANSGTVEIFALYPSRNEYWERFPDVAIAVARELLADVCVLTEIQAFRAESDAKQLFSRYSSSETLLRVYFETLRFHGLADGLQYQESGELITQTKGINIPISTLLFSGEFGLFSYNAYGYSSLPAIETFLQMKEQIENAPHILHLEYGRLPDELCITMDTRYFSPKQCISYVQELCQTFGIPLKIDSKLARYIQ